MFDGCPFGMVLLLMYVCCCLVGALEFLEEALVVLGEEAEVLNLILKVGDTLHAEAEGVALIACGVDAVGFQHGGVNHAATEDFHPSGLLAEGASLAAADIAADVHLG